ncbi:unnamed protein product [Musa hybrid cultivar]
MCFVLEMHVVVQLWVVQLQTSQRYLRTSGVGMDEKGINPMIKRRKRSVLHDALRMVALLNAEPDTVGMFLIHPPLQDWDGVTSGFSLHALDHRANGTGVSSAADFRSPFRCCCSLHEDLNSSVDLNR